MAETSVAKGVVVGALLAGGRRLRGEMVSPGGGLIIAGSAGALELAAQQVVDPGSHMDHTLDTAAALFPVMMGVGGWVDKIGENHPKLERFLKVTVGSAAIAVGTAMALDHDRNPFNGIPNPLHEESGVTARDAAVMAAAVVTGWVAGDGLHAQVSAGAMPRA